MALLKLLKAEVDELEESIKEDDYFHTLTEAADVANFALILAWNVWLLASKPGYTVSVTHIEGEGAGGGA